MTSEERLVCLQPVEIIGAHTREDAQTAVTECVGQYLREALGFPSFGSGIKFLPLIDIEENAFRRLAFPLLQFVLRGADQIRKPVVTDREVLGPSARQSSLVGILYVEVPQEGEGGDKSFERGFARTYGKGDPTTTAPQALGPRV